MISSERSYKYIHAYYKEERREVLQIIYILKNKNFTYISEVNSLRDFYQGAVDYETDSYSEARANDHRNAMDKHIVNFLKIHF